MNRVQVLLSTPSVTLRAFDHPESCEHTDPALEMSTTHAISFVVAGTFDIRAGHEHWHFEPGTMFVTSPGFEFSCSHDRAEPVDRCLSVSFTEQTIEELRGAGVGVSRHPQSLVASRQRFLQQRLADCAPGQEMRLELMAGALFESLDAEQSISRRHASRVAARGQTHVMQCVARAIELAENEFARPLTLSQLASAAGMSAFHFARVFRELTGLPPHRYLTAVRLRHAAHLLDQGAGVTTTCYDVGFGSLSHFVTAFRKRFGVAPGTVKRGSGYAALKPALRAAPFGKPSR